MKQSLIAITELPWFALRVKPRHEKSVSSLIEAIGYECFLPTHTVSREGSRPSRTTMRPLFPGYLFARFDRGGWVRLMNMPGVIDAVRFGKLLASIENHEIESLRLVQQSGYPVEPITYFPAGHQLEIQDGPLAGLQGSVIDDNGQRHLVLSVTLLQRSVRVKINRESVTSVALTYVRRPAA